MPLVARCIIPDKPRTFKGYLEPEYRILGVRRASWRSGGCSMNPPKVRDSLAMIYKRIDQELKLSEEGFNSGKATDNPQSFIEA
jgi:hypothetical protein